MWKIVVIYALILDLILGDPFSKLHPVRFIGFLITKTEKIIRPIFSNELIAGTVFASIVCAITGGLVYFITAIPFKGMMPIHVILCYYIIAMKSLKTESMKVYYALKNDGLEAGRTAVSYIVGRDTKNLTEEGVIKAAVETVAENCTDGVISPIFYTLIMGPIGGYVYKAVNTMDSMVGYKNDKYLYFGRFAAKLDDVLNFIPSRIGGLSMIVAAFFLRLNYHNAIIIFKRDRFNHKSPNSAQTEAACAGALGIQLAGEAWYFGQKYEKPFIGDKLRQVNLEDIVLANKLHYTTCIISLIFMIAALDFIGGILLFLM